MVRRREKGKIQKLIIFLSILLIFNLAALAITFLHNKWIKSAVSTVEVSDNYISQENEVDNSKYLSKNQMLSATETIRSENTKDIDISLYKDHSEDNAPFHMGNMFPGDSETHYFKVKVFYKNSVTVHYRVDIRSDDADFADELKMKIIMYQDGKEMYNGSVGNMPESLTYQLHSEKNTSSELDYEITAYLDTSAGNEFQNKDLAVDFRWWVEETNNLIPAVKTGDQLKLIFGILAVCVSGILILLIMLKKHKGEKNMDDSRTAKKLTGSILLVILLIIGLAVTTIALIYANISLENNLFHTGEIKINLNDGNPVIREDEFLFEPGMTVKKEFFIENESTWDVYYKIYLADLSGGLADILQVTIKDGDQIISKGTPNELVRGNVKAAEETLKIGQRKTLTVYFYYPKDSGNETQDRNLTFTICADATQTKNNPERLFD